LFYTIVKIWIRLGLSLFCRRITFNDPCILKSKAPLLLACNHPNSFLDAIIVGSHFNRPVHFLARGDVFRNPLAKKILTALKMIPIYRLSEGREYLALNDATFEKCGEILAGGGIVLIFAEGLCINQWVLRPLKKGAARIAWTAFANPGIQNQFRVIPVGINYNSFDKSGKRVIVNFENPITISQFPALCAAADFIQQFNQLLQASLQRAILSGAYPENLIIQWLISNYSNGSANNINIIADIKMRQQNALNPPALTVSERLKSPGIITTDAMHVAWNVMVGIILWIPAWIGWLLHAPVYYPLRKLVLNKTRGTVFYDSAIFGGLLIVYPIYWMLMNTLSLLFLSSIVVQAVILLMPAFSWLYLIWKDCMERVRNYLLFPRRQRIALAEVLFH